MAKLILGESEALGLEQRKGVCQEMRQERHSAGRKMFTKDLRFGTAR